jgi:sodium-dependent dicarboxylate transporter 2/3/5
MVVASIMPLLKHLGKNSSLSKGLLVGIPLASATGGMSTIIGTPPNLIAAGALENAGIRMDFLQWMGYGVPLALFLTAIGCFVLTKVFIKVDQPLSAEFLQTKSSEIVDPNLRSKRRIVMIIVIITLLLWMTSSLHNLSVSAVAAIPIVFLTMTGVVDAKDVRGLSWDTLLMVAGGLSLGLALQETGLLNHYAQKVVSMEIHSVVILSLLAYIAMLFSNVMSHTAASTVMIPLGMAILPHHKTEASLIIGLATSTALFLPVSTPANAIAYSTGYVEQKDFRVGGILIGLIGPAAVILWVLLLS